MLARTLFLRRAARQRPFPVPLATVPRPLLPRRAITISAPGSDHNPNNNESPSSSSSPSSSNPNPYPDSDSTQSSGSGSGSGGEIIGLPVSAFSASSQHPFASSDSSSSSFSPPPDPNQSSVPVTSLPSPPESSRAPHVAHPFDTHAFVAYLEKSGMSSGTSRTMMEAVRELIVQRSNRARDDMISKEDMDNESYLFRAALSELRTELSVRARNDGIALRAMSSAIQREVDGLEQKLKEDIQTLKHDIEIDMNNRKEETRSEMKGFDMAIEEINNKFTISLGDLRTETERAKWDATRRAISIIALLVIAGVGVSTFALSEPIDPKPPAPKSESSNGSTSTTTNGYGQAVHGDHHSESDPAPMRDVAVGTEDEVEFGDTEARLEKLLAQMERPKPERRESKVMLSKSLNERI